MGGEPVGEVSGALVRWRDGGLLSSRRRGRRVVALVGLLRFAFYGRLSTKEHQDADTSRRWQLENAVEVIGGAGTIVVEFLDVGFTRRRPWMNRPQAAVLLAAVTGGSCEFDAVVVGEYERACCGNQVFQIAGLLRKHGGAVVAAGDPRPGRLGRPGAPGCADRAGCAIVAGGAAGPTACHGRDAGADPCPGPLSWGRPPYGYRLVDAGPHPTASHARWGPANAAP